MHDQGTIETVCHDNPAPRALLYHPGPVDIGSQTPSFASRRYRLINGQIEGGNVEWNEIQAKMPPNRTRTGVSAAQMPIFDPNHRYAVTMGARRRRKQQHP
jgi:hypothetical protein